ncbi:hypothetical protein B8W93_10970 [Lentilactobacillus kefiri]|nr:hypothetical protein B8W85_11150 [Lentilactobacillus kefiri]PAL05245.1 hypothetical protein B8W93_10970 [Lentilactobacillus kefiri]
MKFKSLLLMITAGTTLGIGMTMSMPTTHAAGYQRVKTQWQSSPAYFQVKSQYKHKKVYMWNSKHTKRILQLNNYPNTIGIAIILTLTNIMVSSRYTMVSVAGRRRTITLERALFGADIFVQVIIRIIKPGTICHWETFPITRNMLNILMSPHPRNFLKKS